MNAMVTGRTILSCLNFSARPKEYLMVKGDEHSFLLVWGRMHIDASKLFWHHLSLPSCHITISSVLFRSILSPSHQLLSVDSSSIRKFKAVIKG